MTRSSARLPAMLAALGMILTAGAAQAWEFDEDSGRLVTTGSVAWNMEGLDSLPEGLEVLAFNERFRPVDQTTVQRRFIGDDKALEGDGAMLIGGEVIYAALPLEGLNDSFEGRRVSFNVWIQPRGTTLSARVYWFAGPAPNPLSGLQLNDADYIGSVSLMPTGRETSDGWRELSTGPVDWQANSSGPAMLTLLESQVLAQNSSFLQSYTPAHRVAVDALEIIDLGESRSKGMACNRGQDESRCGEGEGCQWGVCVDGAILTNALPSEALRRQFLDRKIAEFKAFEAGVIPQSLIPAMAEQFAALVDGTAIGFWQGMREGIASLRDGHASAPFEDFRQTANGGICMTLGDADLLPGRGEAPMVLRLSGSSPLSELLRVGDALVSIDGKAVFADGTLPIGVPVHAGDPVVANFVRTPAIMGGVIQAGSLLGFERCDKDTEGPCAEDELERFEVDLANLLGDEAWADGLPSWASLNAPCDGRLDRLVADPPQQSAEYAYVGSSEDGERAYLLINGTPDPGTNQGQWGRAVDTGLGWAPSEAILDHREGGGGTVTGVNRVAGYLIAPEEFGHIDWFPYFGERWSPDLYALIRQCQDDSLSALIPVCGFGFHWRVFDDHPDPGGASDAKLAILIGRDVSGNDFLTELLRRRGAPTRIFGSPATYGAFGTIVGLPPLLDEFAGGSVQISDSIFFDAPYETGAPVPDFTTGIGVPADEVILQKQSDAMAGIDTVLTRATEWMEED